MMSRWTLIAGGFGLFILSIVGAAISGDIASWWWHAGTIAASIAIPLLLRDVPQVVKTVIKRVFVAVVLVASLALVTVYVLELMKLADTANLHAWLNKNVLVSGVVFMAFAAAILAPQRALIFVALAFALPFISMARTPLIAVGVGVVTGIFLGVFFQMGRRKRFWQVTTLIAIVGLAISPIIVNRVYEEVFKPQNLLLSTNDLSSQAWSHTNALYADVQPLPESMPPGSGGTVQQLHIIRDEGHQYGASPIYQRGEVSRAGESYVASVWLRATEDTKIIVSSNLNWVVCSVTSEWSRCVVPPATGDGVTRAQFLFQFLGSQSEVKFEAWGPQLELGVEATPVQHRSSDGSEYELAKQFLDRLNIDNWSADTTFQSRITLWKVSLQGIVEKPVAGHGLFQFASYFRAVEPSLFPEFHSHNLFLEVLFERGIIGIIVLFAQFALIIRFLRPDRAPAALLVIFLVLLESANFQLYSTLVYYPFWLALSLLPMQEKR